MSVAEFLISLQVVNFLFEPLPVIQNPLQHKVQTFMLPVQQVESKLLQPPEMSCRGLLGSLLLPNSSSCACTKTKQTDLVNQNQGLSACLSQRVLEETM